MRRLRPWFLACLLCAGGCTLSEAGAAAGRPVDDAAVRQAVQAARAAALAAEEPPSATAASADLVQARQEAEAARAALDRTARLLERHKAAAPERVEAARKAREEAQEAVLAVEAAARRAEEAAGALAAARAAAERAATPEARAGVEAKAAAARQAQAEAATIAQARDRAQARADAAAVQAERAEAALKAAETDLAAAEARAKAADQARATLEAPVLAADAARAKAADQANQSALEAARLLRQTGRPVATRAALPVLPALPGSLLITPYRLMVNDVGQIPIGVFSHHASRLTPEEVRDWGVEGFRQIYQEPSGRPVLPGEQGVPGIPEWVVGDFPLILETWFDRYQPAWPIRRPGDWQEVFRKLAASYGPLAAKTGRVHHIQLWNEPHVNWPSGPGVNFDGSYYDQTDTAVGKPMTLKGQDKPVEHLVWSKPQLRAVHVKTGEPGYLATRYGPQTLPDAQGVQRPVKDGDTFEFRGEPFRFEMTPWGNDSSRSVVRPGLASAKFYADMFDEFARTLKETGGDHVRTIVGWCHGIYSGNYASWEHLNKPVVDRSWKYLDGISDHRYGSDPWLSLTSYEVVWAYVAGKYGKRQVKFYNTEAGFTAGRPPAPRQGQDYAPVAFDYGKKWLDYMLRDVSMMLAFVPDKIVTRCEHEPHNNTGSRVVFQLFKNLRGDLVRTASPDPRLWAVASLTPAGNAPTAGQPAGNAPAPAGASAAAGAAGPPLNQLCVIVYNDDAAARQVPIVVDAPPGRQFVGGVRQWIVSRNLAHGLATRLLEVTHPSRHIEQVTLEPRSAVKLLLDLAGDAPAPLVTRRQFVSAEILAPVAGNTPLELRIAIPQSVLDTAAAAVLRCATEGFRPDQHECLVNGRPVALNPVYAGVNDTAIDPGLLKPETVITWRSKEGQNRPFKAMMTSVIVESAPGK